jgi:hypothetical protein
VSIVLKPLRARKHLPKDRDRILDHGVFRKIRDPRPWVRLAPVPDLLAQQRARLFPRQQYQELKRGSWRAVLRSNLDGVRPGSTLCAGQPIDRCVRDGGLRFYAMRMRVVLV